MSRKEYIRPKSFIKNKAFYIALVVTFLALGTFSYGAMSKLKSESSSATSEPELFSMPESLPPVSDTSIPEVLMKEETETDPQVPVEAPTFFTMPITGEILKNYDEQSLQYSETYQDWRIHLGVDIAAARGSTVFASAAGVVEDIYEDPALGVVMAIDHGKGLIAYYCGLDQDTTVQIGDQVESGKQIGVLDMIPCESVEQSHLHLEIEIDGKPVAPLETIGLTR